LNRSVRKVREPKNAKARNNAVIKSDRKLVENALRGYLSGLKGPKALRRAMEHALFSGGKRLRPILAIESASVFNGSIKKILPVASAIELVHNFSLVHDDLPGMDDDDLRRGKPACHIKFGEGIAILAGDALLNLAFGILAGAKGKNSAEIALSLSSAVGSENMIGGQALDIEHAGKNVGAGGSRLRTKINRMKTAALMAVSCKIGALASGAKKRDIEKMWRFGMDLGLAFQIADDIRDLRKKGSQLKKMKKELTSYIAKAKAGIAPFGRKASALAYIAESVLESV